MPSNSNTVGNGLGIWYMSADGGEMYKLEAGERMRRGRMSGYFCMFVSV